MKKGLILLLCLTLAFTVTACGDTVEAYQFISTILYKKDRIIKVMYDY